jgi:cytochrome oxidase Cu insertion factor (SCO1/SenC/PrrC family)
MRHRNLLVSAFAIVLSWSLPHTGLGQEREQIRVAERGPQVGERIPDFTLTDQNGTPWTRDSIAGANGTMLVFLRSADW